jgi:uncharacterized protein YlbG (UPF0298 family)
MECLLDHKHAKTISGFGTMKQCAQILEFDYAIFYCNAAKVDILARAGLTPPRARSMRKVTIAHSYAVIP